MTHILFVAPYYPPEITPPAIRISETAMRLVKLGHQVTVLTTFPNFPTGVVPPEYRGRVIQHEVRDEVHIVRVWSYICPNKGFLRRIFAQLSFGCLAPLIGWKAVGHPDVIIVESPPLFNAIGGRMLARGKNSPFIFIVADPWPEAAIQTGMLRNRAMIRLAEWLEWSTYRRASKVWVVTEAVRDLLTRRGLSPERIFLVPNGVDGAKFRPLPRTQARQQLGWAERFTVLYAGNHGLVYSMTTILDAAERLQDYPDIHIMLVGNGVKKPELMAEAQRRNLKNVTFQDATPHDQMPLLWAAADVCLIPLRRIPLNETTYPVKMFEIMACARPFILGAEGIARQLAVEEAEAALPVEPENADALVRAILYVYEHPEVAEAMGRRGRTFVEARFDRDRLTTILETHLRELCGADKSAVGAINRPLHSFAGETTLASTAAPPHSTLGGK